MSTVHRVFENDGPGYTVKQYQLGRSGVFMTFSDDTMAHPPALLAVIAHAPNLVSLSEFVTGRVMYLNSAGRRLLGLAHAEVSEHTTAEFFTDVGWIQAAQVEHELHSTGEWNGRSEFRHFGTGEAIPVALSTFVVERLDGKPSVIGCIARDLRAEQEQEQQLEIALEKAAYRAREQQALAELSRLAVAADLDAVLAAAASAAAELMGMACASIAQGPVDGGKGDLIVRAYRGPGPAPHRFPAGDQSHPGYTAEQPNMVICADRDTETRFATEGMSARGLCSGICVPIGTDTVWGVLTAHSTRARAYSDRDALFLRSITDILSAAIRRIDAETELQHRSSHDPLTGLPNRSLAHQRIDEALASVEPGCSVALLLIDVDNFKSLNDTHGHLAGDEALVALAQHLRGLVRAGDTVARMGGDEFLAVCRDIGVDGDVVGIATRIAVPASERTPQFTASVGVALSEPGEVRDELIHRADTAMYQAKTMGTGYALAAPRSSFGQAIDNQTRRL